MAATVALACHQFCVARMYDGGFDSKSPKECLCFEKISLLVPAAIENFNLQIKKQAPEQEPEPIQEEEFSYYGK